MSSPRFVRRFDLRRRSALLLVVLFVLTLIPVTSRPAEAINITVVYDPTVTGAVDPCGEKDYASCPDGENRTDETVLLVQIAAAYWATIFHDSHLYDIRVAWKVGGLPSAQTTNIDASGHPTSAIVRVPADMAFWYDPTPFDDEEFTMAPRLYRDTHPAEQAEAFNGDPLEIFEVGYNGPDSGQGLDLLTILLHELGHALGLDTATAVSGREPACDEDGDPYYHLDPNLLGGAVMSLKAYEMYGEFPIKGDGAARRASDTIDRPSLGFDCAHLALGGIQECDDDSVCESHQALMWTGLLPNARSRPSIADILAIATSAGWQEIHLPRKYSLASGNWTSGDTWLGTRVPNAGNNVYIINRDDHVEIDLYELGTARDVVISDGNELNVLFGKLDAYRVTMSGEDTTLLADSATVDVVYLTNGAGGLLDLTNHAFVDAFWTLTTDGLLRGGGDSVVEAHDFVNHGTVRANGGALTIRASHDGPALDLDGTDEWPYDSALDATAGDLVFDGVITDMVNSAVTVGDGHSITFTQGWQQAYTGQTATALLLDGMTADATIHGDSNLSGIVIVDGRGRFTSPVAFLVNSRLQIDIDGMTPVSGHDQVAAEQSVTFAGALDLTVGNPSTPDEDDELDYVTPGFVPDANDEFVIMTYASHSGEFVEITGWDLGGMRLYPEYDDTELRIVARLIGDVDGDGQLTEDDLDAQFPFVRSYPGGLVPHPGDIDGDGDIDSDDIALLEAML